MYNGGMTVSEKVRERKEEAESGILEECQIVPRTPLFEEYKHSEQLHH